MEAGLLRDLRGRDGKPWTTKVGRGRGPLFKKLLASALDHIPEASFARGRPGVTKSPDQFYIGLRVWLTWTCHLSALAPRAYLAHLTNTGNPLPSWMDELARLAQAQPNPRAAALAIVARLNGCSVSAVRKHAARVAPRFRAAILLSDGRHVLATLGAAERAEGLLNVSRRTVQRTH